MKTDYKKIMTAAKKFAGVKNCLAAGAAAMGAVALAVLGGISSTDHIEERLSEETDIVFSEPADPSADMEYFTEEELLAFMKSGKGTIPELKGTADKPETVGTKAHEEDIPESRVSEDTDQRYGHDYDYYAYNEDADAGEDGGDNYTPAVSVSVENTSYDNDYDDNDYNEETEDFSGDSYAETERESEDSSDDGLSSGNSPADVSGSDSSDEGEDITEGENVSGEKPDAVSGYNSAANGGEDEGGLASVLDIDFSSAAAKTTAFYDDPYYLYYFGGDKTDEDRDGEVSGDKEDDDNSSGETDVTDKDVSGDADTSEEDKQSDKDEDISDKETGTEKEEEDNSKPEDIFGDEPEEKEEKKPEERAISRFALPDWLKFDKDGKPADYIKTLKGESCAYTADPDALMSTGKKVFQGYVAVDPDIIPYGSELYIIGENGEIYGYAIAADTGYSVGAGDILIDLFMDEYDDCINWGRRNVTVYVLSSGK